LSSGTSLHSWGVDVDGGRVQCARLGTGERHTWNTCKKLYSHNSHPSPLALLYHSRASVAGPNQKESSATGTLRPDPEPSAPTLHAVRSTEGRGVGICWAK